MIKDAHIKTTLSPDHQGEPTMTVLLMDKNRRLVDSFTAKFFVEDYTAIPQSMWDTISNQLHNIAFSVTQTLPNDFDK